MGGKSYSDRNSLHWRDFWNDPTSPPSNYDHRNISIYADTYDRIGSNNPNWRSQIAFPMNAGTPMKVTVVKWVCHVELDSSFEAHLTFPTHTITGGNSGAYPNIVMPGSAPPAYNPSLEDEVNSKAARLFWKKLRKLDHQFQGGVFLGEIAKTVGMITNPLGSLKKGIASYLRAVSSRTKGVRKPKNLKRVIGDTWLEYSFGWTPLLSDVRDAATALARLYGNVPQTRIKAAAGAQTEPSVVTGTVTTAEGIVHRTKTLTVHKYDHRYYGALRAVTNDRTIRSQASWLASISGFDFRSFLPTIWELVPWSFLIDYFSNAGDLLEQVSTDTSRVVWINDTTNRQVSVKLNGVIDVAATNAPWGVGVATSRGTAGVGEVSRRVIDRFANTAFPYQGLQLSLGLNVKQIVNIVALVSTGKLLSSRLGRQSFT